MVRTYSSRGLNVRRCLSLVGLSKNHYYYKQTGRPKGRRPSTSTEYKDRSSGEIEHVANTDVVRRIVEIKLDPDHANYYRLITKTLCLEGYYINHKKVYRLMHEHLLLEDKNARNTKRYVQHRRVAPHGPLEVLEMDIKYLWIHEKKRYAYVFTVIDTYTRYVLHWAVGLQMKSNQVQEVWEYIITHYLQVYKGKNHQVEIEVRSDNGSQFSSHQIVDFFESNELTQVFTHPYTPEENGHIESFHKTLSKALSKDRFSSLTDLEKRLTKFYLAYNNKRAHGSILGLPPSIFWSLVSMNKIKVQRNEKKRSIRFELKVAYQDILSLPNIKNRQYRVLRT